MSIDYKSDHDVLDHENEPFDLAAALDGMHISSNVSNYVSTNTSQVPCSVHGAFEYGGESFDELRSDMHSVTEDKGVYKKLLRTGQTSRPLPTTFNDRLWVLVKYTSHLEGSIEPLDSDYKKVWKFYPCSEDFIPGFAIALLTMCPMEKSIFIFSPEYFYGEQGCEPRVPRGGAHALYFINMIDHNFDLLPRQLEGEQPNVNGELQAAYDLQSTGNDMFRKKEYMAAMRAYNSAIDSLEKLRAQDSKERSRIDRRLLPLYLNAQQTSLLRDRCPYAVQLGKSALNIDQQNIKALYRTGVAYRRLGKFSSAEFYLNKALKLEPNHNDVHHQLGLTRLRVTDCMSQELCGS